MALIVHSPYSGREVKIRDQDVGRAVRDEENRIFYVLERADGSGHYSAPTRAGNLREEARYDELLAKISATRASGQLNSEQQIHDAQGRPRANLLARVILIIIVLAILAGAYLYFTGRLNALLGRQGAAPPLQPLPAPTLPEIAPPKPTTMLPTPAAWPSSDLFTLKA
jgi:hypothetical protein